MNKKSIANSDTYSPKKILVPTDGSANGTRALNAAIEIAKTLGAEIIVLDVIPTPAILISTSAFGATENGIASYYEQQEESANHFIEEAEREAKTQGVFKVSSEVIRADKSVVEEIIDAALSNKVDLIVVGTRGLGGFKKLLLGSVSSGVVAHAHCNVLIVR